MSGEVGHVVVDDVGDGRDVQAAGGHVGGDQDRHAPALEGEHHAVARALGHVAVQRPDVHAAVAQRAEQLVAADLRAHEHDRLVGPLRAAAPPPACPACRVASTGSWNCATVSIVSVVGLDLDDHRVVHVAVGELADRRRHGGREQRRLAAGGGQREDLLDVLEEAEVEHLVGLVEDHEAAVVQHERVARDQVEHPPDGPHDDVPAGPQLGLLGADRGAAEDGHHVDPGVGAVGAQRLGDLDAQLPRGRQHERLHRRARAGSTYSMIGSPKAAVLPVPVCAWPITSRPSSSGGIACSWIGLGRLVADVAQRVEGGLGEPEFGECRGHRCGRASVTAGTVRRWDRAAACQSCAARAGRSGPAPPRASG